MPFIIHFQTTTRRKSIFILVFAIIYSLVQVEAGEVSLFPLFSAENNEIPGEKEINILYPLFQYRSTPEKTQTRIPVLFSYEKDKEENETLFDVLWPIFTWSRRPRSGNQGFDVSMNFFLLFSQVHKTLLEKQYTRRTLFPFLYYGNDWRNHKHFILFPFLWYADKATIYMPFPSTRPQTYRAFIPFYGEFFNLAGNDSIRTILWPCFIRVKHEDRVKYYILWPFFGWGSGENYRSFKIWPLATWGKHPDGSFRMNYLWPFGYHRRSPLENGEELAFDMLFPFFLRLRSPQEKWDHYFFLYGRRISPKRRQLGMLWPLFKTAFYPDTGGRSVTLFALLFSYRWGDDIENFRIFPFYGKRKYKDKERVFIGWPFYQYRFDRFNNLEFSRNYLVPFYMRKLWKWDNGEEKKSTTVFPFYSSSRNRDGTWKTMGPRLMYHDSEDAVERNWESALPLYRASGDDEGHYEKRIFWKLYHREKRPGLDFLEVNTMLFQWKRKNKTRSFDLLGGLFGLSSEPGKTHYKIFYFTIN